MNTPSHLDMNTLVQVRLSVIVIPDLIREPVVCSNVAMRGCFHSGSRIKSGMTITESLTWTSDCTLWLQSECHKTKFRTNAREQALIIQPNC